MDPQEQAKEWVGCDPVTLVAAAREGIASIPESSREKLAPLQEVVSRFDHLSRATLGTSASFAGQTAR